MTGNAIAGAAAAAFTGARQSGTRMPASIAPASAVGMRRTRSASGRNRPAAVSRTPQTMNAPTASGKPPAGVAVAASKAPPGVDHATEIGIR